MIHETHSQHAFCVCARRCGRRIGRRRLLCPRQLPACQTGASAPFRGFPDDRRQPRTQPCADLRDLLRRSVRGGVPENAVEVHTGPERHVEIPAVRQPGESAGRVCQPRFSRFRLAGYDRPLELAERHACPGPRHLHARCLFVSEGSEPAAAAGRESDRMLPAHVRGPGGLAGTRRADRVRRRGQRVRFLGERALRGICGGQPSSVRIRDREAAEARQKHARREGVPLLHRDVHGVSGCLAHERHLPGRPPDGAVPCSPARLVGEDHVHRPGEERAPRQIRCKSGHHGLFGNARPAAPADRELRVQLVSRRPREGAPGRRGRKTRRGERTGEVLRTDQHVRTSDRTRRGRTIHEDRRSRTVVPGNTLPL